MTRSLPGNRQPPICFHRFSTQATKFICVQIYILAFGVLLTTIKVDGHDNDTRAVEFDAGEQVLVNLLCAKIP